MSPKRRILPIFVPHLGCPNACVFCDQRLISGEALPATAQTIREAVRRAGKLPPEGPLELAFYGGSFTAIPPTQRKALLEAALPFLRSGEISSIRVSTRPDAVDEARLRELTDYGVGAVELGAQSMLDRVLAVSGRGHRAEDTRRAAALVKAAGLSLVLQMMTGLPGDDDEGALETARQLIALGPDGARIYPTVILKDTALYRLWLAGAYQEHTVSDAVRVCAAILPLFEAAGIPVIRLGLNPGEELTAGQAAGGAYHPALGELVRGEILLRRARGLFDQSTAGKDAVLGIRQGLLSAMIGQNQRNIRALTEEFGLRSLKISSMETVGDEIRLISLK